MNIAIAGAGVSGGYLAALLALKGLSPDVFDGMNHATRCGCRSCGWGVPTNVRIHLAGIGLDLDDYLLEPMPSMNFDGLVAKTPLLTIDKPRLLGDLTTDVAWKHQNLSPEKAEEYDIVVDATGINRAYLPACRSDLILPTLQQRIAVEPDGGGLAGTGVYGNRIPGLGYLWIFPLGGNQYHVGVGGIGLVEHDLLLEQFYKEASGQFSFTTLCGCRSFIRVSSPYYATPLFFRNTGNDGMSRLVIGVGESIGTVSPFAGEGIIYSLECAKILADSQMNPERYAAAVLARFDWMRKERETLDYLLSRKGKTGPRLRDRWRFYRNARRSGIGLPMIEAFKRIGSLSRWVDDPNGRTGGSG